MEPKSHWEQVYTANAAEAVSWYQPHATLSLELILRVGHDKSARIVDVGPGAGEQGGRIVASGTPADVCASQDSRTAPYLQRHLA